MAMRQTIIPTSRQSRRLRRPTHTFYTKQRPWQLQPFLIAPVLPGETLRNMNFQARAVTDPLRNPLQGWHLEFYFFYVKHRDMPNRDEYTAMVLDLASTPTTEAANTNTYHAGGHVDWVQQCLDTVVPEFFRNEGETEPTALDGLPPASINDRSFLDSAALKDDYTAQDVSLIDAATTDVLYASEVDEAMRQWEFMKLNGLTEMSYEDFLASYGIRRKETEIHRPELIRYVRQWTYPTNTIDPTDGSAASAASWAVAERADKDRFFTEPGFIFGLSTVRPKVIRAGQVGAAVAGLDTAMGWLPAILSDDPRTSIRAFANTDGPINVTDADGYVLDLKDLYMYGDQFHNYDITADANVNQVDLPTATLQKRYPVVADAYALFADNAAPGTYQHLRMDGIVSLSIASSQRDVTPTTYKTS